MGDLIKLVQPPHSKEHFACPDCGNVWMNTVVVFEYDHRDEHWYVTGYSPHLSCDQCGSEISIPGFEMIEDDDGPDA